MHKSAHKKTSIARQFILYIILFSSFLTLIITALQIFRDYNSDIELIESELQQIESVHLESLTEALWASNTKLLQTSIEGILKIRDMQYIEVHDSQKIWAEAGELISQENIQRIYPMIYSHRNKNVNIGTLTVNVNLKGVYKRLYNTIWVILISNAIKTSLVAIFIYFLFYRLIARHLSNITKFAEEHDLLTNNTPILLDRNHKNSDEFDTLVEAINGMRTKLHEQITEINQQKQHLSLTLNSIGDAVITTDNKGHVTRLNYVAEQLTGWTNKDAHNLPLKSIFPIVDATTREEINNPVEKVLTTGETVYLSNHTTLISKNGTEYQIADSAAPIMNGEEILGMVLVFNDMTEQYKLRKAVADSEAQVRLLLNSTAEAIYGIDKNGHATFVNQACLNMLGYENESEFIGQNIHQLIHYKHPDGSDYPVEECHIYKSLHAESGSHNNDELFWRKDGTGFNVEYWSYPIFNDDICMGTVVTFFDITERKKAEEISRRSQKMNALGKLTGGIAHDYNNMLGVILGYAEILIDELEQQKVLQKYAHQIRRASERGAKLTKKLLNFSKNRSSNASILNINNMLKEDQHMLGKSLTARIQIELKLEENCWDVNIDENELEDAILNISINAMHAIPHNGTLTYETANEHITTNNAHKLIAGDYVRLSISDTGSGISDDIKEQIFDPFFTTKGDKGTGLGLSQVYGFVKRSEGTIEVKSVIGHGTTFSIYLPRAIGSEKHPLPTVFENTKIIKGAERILVVDDEAELLELTCTTLKRHGYTIFCAENGKAALEIMATEVIDVLFSDIIMPDIDGYELASITQEKYPHIKIQLTSGFAGEKTAEHLGNPLFNNILPKPYDMKNLLECMHTLIS